MQKNKIGLGLITCDRSDFFKQSYSSVKSIPNKSFVVVDDGNTSVKDLINFDDNSVHYIKTNNKQGVAVAKNKALKYLMESECEHIFLMEDDITIKDDTVFDAYIKASNETGIKHFNFGLHGNHNLDYLGRPVIQTTINYPNKIRISLFPNVLGAFSYYHRDTIDKCGYMDENFYNALEHVDHTYQIIKAGYHPPFRWFADIENSTFYIQDIVKNHDQSKIRSQDDFMKNFVKALDYFLSKNKFSVVNGYGRPETIASEKEVIESLKKIYNEQHK
jgi:GT2 family glycosyltransferase